MLINVYIIHINTSKRRHEKTRDTIMISCHSDVVVATTTNMSTTATTITNITTSTINITTTIFIITVTTTITATTTSNTSNTSTVFFFKSYQYLLSN